MIKIPIAKCQENIRSLLRRQGHNTHDSEIISSVLMYAELRGNNQGIIKLISRHLLPSTDSKPIQKLFDTPVSAKYDGNQNIGMVAVHHCVEDAIKKAKISGISIVGVSNYSSATGALGHWAKRIASEDLIGIVMSQCPEYVAPHGSFEPIFGTNPIAIGIPTLPRPQVLDMATSATAYYALVTAEREGRPIPCDVAVDAAGRPTTDPAAALRGALLPFDRGHKGSHLGLMVELLAGALTGASMEDKAAARNWGSVVVAIDPRVLGHDNLEAFRARAAVMCARVKGAKRLPDSPPGEEIYLPGERGDLAEAAHLAAGVISVSAATYNELLRQLES